MNKTINNLKYLLKLSRPRFWLYLAGPALLGIILGAETTGQLFTVQNVILMLYFLIPANIMLYGVNDYFDRDIDEENPKKEDKEEKYRKDTFTDVAVGISIFVAFPVILMLPIQALLVMIAFLALSITYSAPPLRFKARPFLDSLSNGLYILPFVISYIAVTSSLPSVELIVAGWIWTMAMHTYSAIPDIVPDRKAGVETTATYFGRQKTYIYCTVLWTFSSLVAGLWNIQTGLLIAAYPVLSVFFYFSGLDDSEAYWYYPYINTLIGMVLAIAGLWVIVHG